MKKQVKVIISSVVIIAILILGLSLFYPAVFKRMTTGTFGKAEKYHKQQMSEKDILLRSELVADTAQLKNMIQGLIYFSLFTQDLSKNIDSCVDIYKSNGICNDPSRCSSVSALEDYSGFIRNNNKTLATTIRLLTTFYLNNNPDESADVEKSLRDFALYVNNLNKKDSTLNLAIRSMDSFMLSNKILKSKQTGLTGLKSIRDQLLLRGVKLAGMLQNKAQCAQLLGYALSSQPALNVILSKPTLNVILNQENLNNYIKSNELGFATNAQLGQIIQSQHLGVIASSQHDPANMVGTVMVYDKDNLQFRAGNKTELQNVLSSSQIAALSQGSSALGVIAGVAVFSSQGLNLYQSEFDLKLFGSQQNDLGVTMSRPQLNQVLSNQPGLGVIYSSDFISMVGQLGSMGMGVDPPVTQ